MFKKYLPERSINETLFNIQETHSYKVAHRTILVHPLELVMAWFIWPQLDKLIIITSEEQVVQEDAHTEDTTELLPQGVPQGSVELPPSLLLLCGRVWVVLHSTHPGCLLLHVEEMFRKPFKFYMGWWLSEKMADPIQLCQLSPMWKVFLEFQNRRYDNKSIVKSSKSFFGYPKKMTDH